MNWLRKLIGNADRSKKIGSNRPASRRVRPGVEMLEDRSLPSVSAITSNFNGTSIKDGSSVWFNSVLKVSGLPSTPVTIHVDNATVAGAKFNVAVPDADITFSPTATMASTTFDTATNSWHTTVPSSGLSGNVFLAGAVLTPSGGLPGGNKPVTWQANFTTDTPGVTVQWQWAAAVYKQFSADYSTLGVKPVDSNSTSQYLNSHHAGTPENFTYFVTGGAQGGGGSNFTGSYSATKSVTPENVPPPPPAPSSLSGYVYLDLNQDGVRNDGDAALSGVEITLTGVDDLGHSVTLTATTGEDGSYSFAGLRPGTYSIGESQPVGYLDGTDTIGTQGGSVDNDLFNQIVLGAGIDGQDNNFGEIRMRS